MERIICKIPAIAIIKITELMSIPRECIIEAVTIATGPVIPEIIGVFTPRIPATKQRIIAPHKPAPAPNPVATPKASACGNAIIAEFIPPKTSPAKISVFALNSDIIQRKRRLNFDRGKTKFFVKVCNLI